MNGHGHVFGHKFVSEAVSEADSDCLHILYVLNYSDKVMTSDTDTTSDMGMSENLGYGLGHGHTSDIHACPLSSGLDDKLNHIKDLSMAQHWSFGWHPGKRSYNFNTLQHSTRSSKQSYLDDQTRYLLKNYRNGV